MTPELLLQAQSMAVGVVISINPFCCRLKSPHRTAEASRLVGMPERQGELIDGSQLKDQSPILTTV